MARSRLIPLILVVILAVSACSPAQPAGLSAVTQTADHPTLSPTPSALPTDTSTPAPVATTTPVVTATSVATATPGGVHTVISNCANFDDPKVKITLPDEIGPYTLFCTRVYGGLGVQILAISAGNKAAHNAAFANPVKVCIQGSGPVLFIDEQSGVSPNLKSTQDGAFICVELTKPGSVMSTR